jgi:hypothetical protein
MRISKALRGNRDIPQLEGITQAAVAAGSAADYEHVITGLPKLYTGAPAGMADAAADNTMIARWFLLTYEATLTGAATNYFNFQLNQRRAGALLVNTTSSTAVGAAGLNTITVGASGAVNCYVGQFLNITGGTGTAETVVVTAFNAVANTITANFANTHSSTYNVVAAPLASISYQNGTNEIAWVTRQISCYPNVIKPGDVLTLSRVSSNSTGLAQPLVTAEIEWITSGGM